MDKNKIALEISHLLVERVTQPDAEQTVAFNDVFDVLAIVVEANLQVYVEQKGESMERALARFLLKVQHRILREDNDGKREGDLPKA